MKLSGKVAIVTGENPSVDGGSLASMYHLIHQLASEK